ncbi:MAG: ACP S-malonyltransferase [Bacilli bacterium]|nr:ACP S-malonyltransferase [Bacilli bacterium]
MIIGKIAFMFPGQGTQYVGMGKDLYQNYEKIRSLYLEGSKNLNLDLTKLSFEGPKEELLKTQNQQPCIHTLEVSLFQILKERLIIPDFVVGYSLGEYAALVASQIFEYKDTVNITRKRGIFMESEVPNGIGKMCMINGLSLNEVKSIVNDIKDISFVEISNINTPSSIIISGYSKGVELAQQKALEKGANKTIFLKVSGPFHTILLKNAGKNLKNELKKIKSNIPKINYIPNYSGEIYNYKNENIIDVLEKHIYMPVLWEKTISTLVENGVRTFIEIGPGKSLCKYTRKCLEKYDFETYVLGIENYNELQDFLKTINK